jgi:hypothetical protein
LSHHDHLFRHLQYFSIILLFPCNPLLPFSELYTFYLQYFYMGTSKNYS